MIKLKFKNLKKNQIKLYAYEMSLSVKLLNFYQGW